MKRTVEKEKTKVKKTKSVPKTPSSNDMRKLLSSIVKDMMTEGKPAAPDYSNFQREEKYATISAPEAVNYEAQEAQILFSSLNSRLILVETKLSSVCEAIDEIKINLKERDTKYELELKKCLGFSSMLEDECNNRTKLLRLVQEKCSEENVILSEKLEKVKTSTLAAITTATEEIKESSLKLINLKETVDDLSIHRYDYLPPSQRPLSSQPKDELSLRILALESKLSGGSELEHAPHHHHHATEGQPHGHSAAGLKDLQKQVAALEKELEKTKKISCDAYFSSTGKKYNAKAAGKVSDNESDEDAAPQSLLLEQQVDLKSLTKRVKQLGDNTSKACRSLSSGLSDVQQATLYLFAWCDRAHGAFATVSAQMGFEKNLCPRVQVQKSNSTGGLPDTGSQIDFGVL